MTTIALKDYLVSKINLINDINILNHLKDELEKSQTVYELSFYQKEKLKKSQLDFENGKFYNQDQMDEKIEKWLKE
jgi:hypothetical protein